MVVEGAKVVVVVGRGVVDSAAVAVAAVKALFDRVARPIG